MTLAESPLEAFRSLFEDNYSPLLAYAARRVASYDDAKDVTAEVFTVAWRRWDDLPGDSVEQRMWLYGVARRALSNRHRTEVRYSNLRERLSEVAEEAASDHAASDDASDLADAVRALNALNPDDREILLLSLWEDLSPAQIATVVDRSASHVSVRIHRAKARLRKEFLQQMKEPNRSGHVIDRRARGDVAPEKTP